MSQVIKLTIDESSPALSLSIAQTQKSPSKLIPMSMEQVRIVHDSGAEEYDGEIEVRPEAFQEQILPTKNKILRDDITIQPIPYYETTNLSGGYTAIIGG